MLGRGSFGVLLSDAAARARGDGAHAAARALGCFVAGFMPVPVCFILLGVTDCFL